jgi:hypothetical protein
VVWRRPVDGLMMSQWWFDSGLGWLIGGPAMARYWLGDGPMVVQWLSNGRRGWLGSGQTVIRWWSHGLRRRNSNLKNDLRNLKIKIIS